MFAWGRAGRTRDARTAGSRAVSDGLRRVESLGWVLSRQCEDSSLVKVASDGAQLVVEEREDG